MRIIDANHSCIRIIHPLMRIIHPFRQITHSLMRIIQPLVRVIHPFTHSNNSFALESREKKASRPQFRSPVNNCLLEQILLLDGILYFGVEVQQGTAQL